MKMCERKVTQLCAGVGSHDHLCNVMNPFVDWGFKYLFGTERNKGNLIVFLNILLELESPLVDLQFLNNESIPTDADGRECVFDILCKDEDGTRFLIEVQNADLRYIRNRMLYYTCRLIEQMGQVGKEWNYEIDKVYSICLMNFAYEPEPVLRRDFLLCEPQTANILTDRIHIIMLQLPCLQAKSIEECNELYEKLLFLLLQMKRGMKTIEELKREVYEHGLNQEIRDTFLNVLEEANLASLSKTDKAQYEARLKRYRDNHACLDYAIEKGIIQGIDIGTKQGLEQGLQQGIQQGLEQGLQQGIQQGIQQGLEQGLEQGIADRNLQIAKSMKNKGLDLLLIAECTGLSVSDVAKL